MSAKPDRERRRLDEVIRLAAENREEWLDRLKRGVNGFFKAEASVVRAQAALDHYLSSRSRRRSPRGGDHAAAAASGGEGSRS